MKRIGRIITDQIGVNQSHPCHLWSITVISIGLLALTLLACAKQQNPENTSPPEKTKSSGLEAGQIIERSRAVDHSRDSTMKLRAQITGTGESSEPGSPHQVQLTIRRKHQPDGRTSILIEFTAPPEERDRDGLITVFSDGRIEVVRYMQSTDSFIVTTDPTSEDGLFGLTPQELAEGQPEKYDFNLVGEDQFEETPVYRLEGRLKKGAESKFPRVVLMIAKRDFMDLKAEFYDNHNELARRLIVRKTELISGNLTRTHWIIENQARSKTIDFEATDVKYDQNLSDAIFTREHVKKIASR